MPPNASTDKPRRILIVDDDHDALAGLAHLFQSAGLVAVQSHSSVTVLEQYLEATESGDKFDFIALDIRMPDVNGNELAGNLREFGYEGKLIAVTGLPSGAGRTQSIGSGFDFYMGKQQLTPDVVRAFLKL